MRPLKSTPKPRSCFYCPPPAAHAADSFNRSRPPSTTERRRMRGAITRAAKAPRSSKRQHSQLPPSDTCTVLAHKVSPARTRSRCNARLAAMRHLLVNFGAYSRMDVRTTPLLASRQAMGKLFCRPPVGTPRNGFLRPMMERIRLNLQSLESS